ncbi:hypothetical protein J2127_001058 [Methanococcus voltae]|uniref:hypothetical protein n=1 Tax=Methanococcus voltae TaxID=2188 RepID=UPI001AE87CAA|nr:hypothetical protein [Methanococcus voltae]MBP2143889.1 hypothetical protein [Methanococcus voltae]
MTQITNNNPIDELLSGKDYDIKKSRNARWIDQKCTPDVLSIIAECILMYAKKNQNHSFKSADIWHNDDSNKLIVENFKKPSTDHEGAKNEYDKFFQQPMELMSYAGILNKEKKRGRNYYAIINLTILEYISLSPTNSLNFLVKYIKKVLDDSSIYSLFQNYFNHQTPDTFQELKQKFKEFTIANTNINGEFEPNRIFIKVMNPLAFKNNAKGTKRGFMSKDIIKWPDLIYSVDNFRDIQNKKPKNLTREEWKNIIAKKNNYINLKRLSRNAVFNYQKYIKNYKNGISELNNDIFQGNPEIHHIFPKSQYPNISHYYENLIALSPNIHTLAHNNGKYSTVNKECQLKLLICKSKCIEENSNKPISQQMCSFDNFMHVLDEGFETDLFERVKTNNFKEVNNILNERLEDIGHN